MKRNLYLLIAVVSLISAACSSSKKTASSSASEPTLKEAYKNDFRIGAALNAEQIEEKEQNAAALVPQQFNAITPENIMKAEIIHPEWTRYNFDIADKIAEYGKKHNMKE